MNKARANLAVVAARASSRTDLPSQQTVMPAHLKPHVAVLVTGPVKRTTCKSGAGSSSYGYGGAWAASADIGGRLGAVIKDSKWSRTVRDGA